MEQISTIEYSLEMQRMSFKMMMDKKNNITGIWWKIFEFGKERLINNYFRPNDKNKNIFK